MSKYVKQFFTKIFEKKEYAESFLNGNIRFNDLEDYTKIEDERKDSREGLAAIFQPNKVKVKVGNIAIPSEDLAAAVTIKYDDTLAQKCLCLSINNYYLSKISFDGNIPFDYEGISKKEIRKFGNNIVLIHSPNKFLNKIVNYFNDNNIGFKYKPVEYEDFNFFHGKINPVGFVKDKKYETEKEFRILAEIKSSGVKTINIGNIRDCAMLLNYDKFKSIKFLVKEN